MTRGGVGAGSTPPPLREVREMTKRVVVGCVLLALTLVLPRTTAAQAAGEMSIGYSFLQNEELASGASNLPWGFFFDAALEVNDFVSVAFDLNGHYRRGIDPSTQFSGGPTDPVVSPLPTQDFQAFSFNRPEQEWCSPVLTVCEVHVQTVGATVGPRFHFRAGRARPYVHGLVGVTRSLRKVGFFAHTATHLAIQPGAGVDFDVTPNVALRFQGDYRQTFFPEPDQSDPGSQASLVNVNGDDFQDFTFSIGFVFKLGAARRASF